MAKKMKMPARGNVEAVLRVTREVFPNYERDPESRQMAIIGLAQVLGAVLGWTYHQNGEEACKKGIGMVTAMALMTATKADSLLRERESMVKMFEEAEKKGKDS